jgi:hypothetical protein
LRQPSSAALEGVLGIGIGRRNLDEIGAGLEFGQGLLRLCLSTRPVFPGWRLRATAPGYGPACIRPAGWRSARVGEKIVDFRIGNHQAVVHLPLFQARDGHLGANLLAESLKSLPSASSALRKASGVKLVVLGDAGHGAVQRNAIEADVGVFRDLHQRLLGDHAFQQLLFQQAARRLRRFLAGKLAQGLFDRLFSSNSVMTALLTTATMRSISIGGAPALLPSTGRPPGGKQKLISGRISLLWA